MEQYLLQHIDEESPLLHELDRQTHLRTIQPRMLSGHIQGSILKMLVRMANPKLVLEVGTFTGYSALSMAEGLSPDAILHTTEIDDEKEPLIREFFSRSKYKDQLILHIGTLQKALSEIDGDIDFVFIDADKRDYLEYYNQIFPRVKKGGFILADNVLWDGHVLEQEPKQSDHHTQAVKQFNDFVASDARVERTILPIRDGVMIIRKK